MEIIDLPQINTKRLDALASSGINTTDDLLYFFPRRYLDRTHVQPISNLAGNGQDVTVIGTIEKIALKGYKRKQRLEVFIKDDRAYLKGVWFRGAHYFKKVFNKGDKVAFFGTVKRYGRYLSIAHPDFEKLKDESDIKKLARILPIYPSNKKFSRCRINSSLIQKWIDVILDDQQPDEFIPTIITDDLNLPERYRAMHMIHFPEREKDYHISRYRFKFEEFFLFQTALGRVKEKVVTSSQGPLLSSISPNTVHFFNHILPFELTKGQKDALSDIKRDVRSGRQMNRLIQGDVGSGKTVVAAGALLMAVDNGFQGAFMAPTEILAEQHYRTLTDFLSNLDISIRLLVGNQKKALRQDILASVEGGSCDIVVGTHAVIQNEVRFNNLGLVIIDEQHRFGVAQRAEILQKGSNPHLLVMSATPIPRSLAMTLYGDLDISLIKELPAGRKPIVTAVRKDDARNDIYSFVKDQIDEGGQAYIVYPLVEESEAMDLKDATLGYEKLNKKFSGSNVALLHGKMDSKDKDTIMQAFQRGETDILVSTTVIEVGVDVPNANIMIIEHAERFGLSQLHQLRGRIGRGERKSYCILMAGEKTSKTGWQRLRTLEQSASGFHIAEQDLKMRGPGDFLGTKQSGLPEFNLADIVEDQSILEKAKLASRKLLQQDPKLEKPQHRKLHEVLDLYLENKAAFFNLL